MFERTKIPVLFLLGLITACASDTTAPAASASSRAPSLGKAVAPTNPTATWELPLSSAGLGLVSDRQFPDATTTYSLYENATCSVSTKIFYYGGSGDATLQTNNPTAKSRTCAGRQMSVVYPVGDVVYPSGGIETMQVFLNIHNIANDTTTIPIGATVERALALNPTQAERCDAWRWGALAGGDNVLVQRLDTRTFHVRRNANALLTFLGSCSRGACRSMRRFHR